MDDTATFSNRSNCQTAAEKMIANGAAPAVDYGFKTREDGRFEIVWKTAEAKASPTTTDEVEAELAAACEQAEADWSEAGEAEAEPPKPTRAPTAARSSLAANDPAESSRRLPRRRRAMGRAARLPTKESRGKVAGR